MNELNNISELIKNSSELIKEWFDEKVAEHRNNGNIVPLYFSLDIRESVYKSSVIDCNIFPAGFNNVSNIDIATKLFSDYLMNYINRVGSNNINRIYLIPENFTRNKSYILNVISLYNIISLVTKKIGIEFSLLILNDYIEEVDTLKSIYLEHDIKSVVGCEAVITDKDILILNTDLTLGAHDTIKSAKHVLPSYNYGWWKRSKFRFFHHYNLLAEDIANLIGIDHWFFSTLIDKCHNNDITEGDGLDEICEKVERLLEKIKGKYSQYNIKESPRVFIKSDNGTFGRANIAVSSVSEVVNLNRRSKNEMRHKIQDKRNIDVNGFLIQECVHSHLTINDNGMLDLNRDLAAFKDTKGAERMFYCISGIRFSEILRLHESKGISDNLNSPGMKLLNIDKYEYKNPFDVLILSLIYLASIEELL